MKREAHDPKAPPTPAHSLEDERTWSINPLGIFSWASHYEMWKMGLAESDIKPLDAPPSRAY